MLSAAKAFVSTALVDGVRVGLRANMSLMLRRLSNSGINLAEKAIVSFKNTHADTQNKSHTYSDVTLPLNTAATRELPAPGVDSPTPGNRLKELSDRPPMTTSSNPANCCHRAISSGVHAKRRFSCGERGDPWHRTERTKPSNCVLLTSLP